MLKGYFIGVLRAFRPNTADPIGTNNRPYDIVEDVFSVSVVNYEIARMFGSLSCSIDVLVSSV